MDEAQIISTYKAILAITHKMLKAAQENDGKRLFSLEQECKKLTHALIANPPQQPLSAEMQKKRIEIIHQILACDAKIRAITEPWMTHLQNLLTHAHKHIN
ncbi:flagellar protein FliT [Nitrosomonas sp. Nm58]|jgi:flagellar protein FliT|uniref:flagellar protein FliT n=1 Tax=Nitrosomonas sp. Nm58 TaxID=200126 RepID=UPI000895200A|nr:flagellar protein FliT [Nitrosomonas sp. Nm58]SDY23304.1 flagellar protein FliT [Nitrosomonas sp. Nm58]